MRRTMTAMLLAVLVGIACASACGKGAVNAACHTDTDCEDGLRCALLESGGDGAKREMCVDPHGTWDLSAQPSAQGWRRFALPAGVAAGVMIVLLLMLRASVRARTKRKRAKSTPTA